MSKNVHPERETRRQEEKRANNRTAMLVGSGTGLVLMLLTGLLFESWSLAVGLGIIVAAAVTFALKAIRKDSRKLVDDVSGSDA